MIPKVQFLLGMIKSSCHWAPCLGPLEMVWSTFLFVSCFVSGFITLTKLASDLKFSTQPSWRAWRLNAASASLSAMVSLMKRLQCVAVICARHLPWICVCVLTAEWEPLPPGYSFFLGEQVHFVAQTGALVAGERLYVDSCHATSSKDPDSTPRLDIITNYGCVSSRNTYMYSSYRIGLSIHVLIEVVLRFVFCIYL